MKASLIIALFFTLFQMQGYGCDCVYNGPFREMSKHVEFVSLVKVTRFLSFKNINGVQMPLAMQAKIIRTYKGKEKRTTVTIWGDNGNLCRPYLDTFKIGQYFVMALDFCKKSKGQVQEKDTDYYIDNCGCYWLSVDISKRIAMGDIDSNTPLLKLNDLKKLFIHI